MELEALRADLAILRIPAGNVDFLRAQSDQAISILHADTLVYYARSLADFSTTTDLPEGIKLEAANLADQASITMLARRGFHNYVSHYHANPRLNPNLIVEGYAEWACAHIGSSPVEGRIDVARAGNRIVGFLSSQGSAQDGSFEVLLNAIDPDYARQGIYSALFGFVMQAYRDAGFSHVSISTQVWNYAVQRVWAKHGLMIDRAYDTFHLSLHNNSSGDRA